MLVNLQITPAGQAVLSSDFAAQLLGDYNTDVLRAIKNNDSLSLSPGCFHAVADLVEKGFITAE